MKKNNFELSNEEKKHIKNICFIFNAQKIWIDNEEVSLPKK